MRELCAVAFGHSGSGKTQMLNRFARNEFYEAYIPTIEELFQCEKCLQGRFVNFKILDTQGLESFNLLREIYIHEANSFIINYDSTQITSLSGLSDLITMIQQAKTPNVPIVLVGTKKDLLEGQDVSKDAVRAGTQLAQESGIPHVLVSAKSNVGIGLVFDQLFKKYLQNEPEDLDSQSLRGDDVESWLYTPSEIAKMHAKPSLKTSLIKLKASMSNLKSSKSIKNLRSIVSKSSFYTPGSGSKHPRSPRSEAKLNASTRMENVDDFVNDLGIANPIKLDEIPTITDVSVVDPKSSKKHQCTVM